MPEDKGEKLTERTVQIAGIEHTMLLNDDDAERYEQAEASRPKAEASTKAKTPENKSRHAEGK
jgi:hypothetical protein